MLAGGSIASTPLITSSTRRFYDKAKFAAITIRLSSPECTTLLFSSGKLVVTGGRTWYFSALQWIASSPARLTPARKVRVRLRQPLHRQAARRVHAGRDLPAAQVRGPGQPAHPVS